MLTMGSERKGDEGHDGFVEKRIKGGKETINEKRRTSPDKTVL